MTEFHDLFKEETPPAKKTVWYTDKQVFRQTEDKIRADQKSCISGSQPIILVKNSVEAILDVETDTVHLLYSQTTLPEDVFEILLSMHVFSDHGDYFRRTDDYYNGHYSFLCRDVLSCYRRARQAVMTWPLLVDRLHVVAVKPNMVK